MHSWYTGTASPSNIIQVQYDNGISTALRDPVLIRSTPFHIQENLHYMPHVLQFATILLGLIDCVTVSLCFNSNNTVYIHDKCFKVTTVELFIIT